MATLYEYHPTVPIDMDGNFVPEGSGFLFRTGDPSNATPLVLRDEMGNPVPGDGRVTINPTRLLPGFYLLDAPTAIWRSGNTPPIPLEAAGARIPRGGTVGQVIRKASADDYAVEWGDPPAGGGEGAGGPGSVMYATGSSSAARPTSSTQVMVIFMTTGTTPPVNMLPDLDIWVQRG